LRNELITTKKIFNTLPWKSLSFLFILPLLNNSGYEQETPADTLKQLFSQYDIIVQNAARSWLSKNHVRALDGFYLAGEFITDHMPSPGDSFAWEGCRVLKTYSIVMARLVEIDMVQISKKKQEAVRLSVQAREWALILDDLSDIWEKNKTEHSEERNLRKRWLKRIRAAIEQVKMKHAEIILQD
jgi:hypothetical protein